MFYGIRRNETPESSFIKSRIGNSKRSTQIGQTPLEIIKAKN